jgi:hypothetical protein
MAPYDDWNKLEEEEEEEFQDQLFLSSSRMSLDKSSAQSSMTSGATGEDEDTEEHGAGRQVSTILTLRSSTR